MCNIAQFHTVTVRGALRTQHIAAVLIGQQVWCDVLPLPGDEFQIRVKGDDAVALDKVCARPTHEFNTMVMPRLTFTEWLRTAAERQSELEPEMGPRDAVGNAVLVTCDEYDRKLASDEGQVVAVVDDDSAAYFVAGDLEQQTATIYFVTGQNDQGWFWSSLLDDDRLDEWGNLTTDDGPYEDRVAALRVAFDDTVEWFADQGHPILRLDHKLVGLGFQPTGYGHLQGSTWVDVEAAQA